MACASSGYSFLSFIIAFNKLVNLIKKKKAVHEKFYLKGGVYFYINLLTCLSCIQLCFQNVSYSSIFYKHFFLTLMAKL